MVHPDGLLEPVVRAPRGAAFDYPVARAIGGHARVAHHRVERDAAAAEALGKGADAGESPEVNHDWLGASPPRPGVFRHLLRGRARLPRAPGGDENVTSRGAHLLGRLEPDAGGRPRDEHGFARAVERRVDAQGQTRIARGGTCGHRATRGGAARSAARERRGRAHGGR
jgi:hypothetical protein